MKLFKVVCSRHDDLSANGEWYVLAGSVEIAVRKVNRKERDEAKRLNRNGAHRVLSVEVLATDEIGLLK